MRRFDLLLTPTVPVPPFAIDIAGPGLTESDAVADDAWTPALYPASLTGQPAASVPVLWTEDGLRVGLQIIGPHWRTGLWSQRRPLRLEKRPIVSC